MPSPERIDIAGTPVDLVSIDAVIEKAVAAAASRHHFQVATVNLDFLVNSDRDPDVRKVLADTALNVPDGKPVIWAARILGVKGTGRVAGADLVPLLGRAAAANDLRLFLLGGENGSSATAADLLRQDIPSLQVAVFEPPRASLQEMDDAAILRRIRDADPHILLVAFGHPKQDRWIHRNRDNLPMVAVGVGGSLDLIAGRAERAPGWAQSVGLEWGFRLLQEPRRLGRRYATDAIWLLTRLLPWALWRRLNLWRPTGSAGVSNRPEVVSD